MIGLNHRGDMYSSHATHCILGAVAVVVSAANGGEKQKEEFM